MGILCITQGTQTGALLEVSDGEGGRAQREETYLDLRLIHVDVYNTVKNYPSIKINNFLKKDQ